MAGFWERIEASFEARDDDLPASADVIVGVGADVAEDGRGPSPYSRSIALKVLDIFRQGRAPTILFLGGNRAVHVPGSITEAEGMAQVVGGRVVAEAVVLENGSRNTIENAEEGLRIMQARGWKSAILVAQQWHARRVRAIFTKKWGSLGMRVAVAKAPSGYGGGSQLRFSHFLAFLLWDTLGFVYARVTRNA